MRADESARTDRRTVSVRMTGRVQGVGFRWWTQGEAEAAGLAGFVRNETDGSVHALLSGPGHAVDAMLERLHTGPAGARVETVEVREANVADVPSGFEVRR